MSTDDPVASLKATLRRLRATMGEGLRPSPAVPGPPMGEGLRPSPAPPALDVRPTNAFEVAVAERLKALEAELDQLRSRINWLLTVIVGAAITNIVIALLK